MRNSIEFEVYGEYGLFSDPLTRIGGEKTSYQIPSYSAIKGIVESIYWKPSLYIIVDKIRVMNPIRMESKGVRPIDYSGGNTLANYTYIREPRYQVQAHFVFNPHRPDLVFDHNENKHYSIMKRALKAGGRRDIYLGTRECQGYVEPCEFGAGAGFYDDYEEINFGVMVHGINYPDETGRKQLEVRLWNPVMRHGVIEFVKPENCPYVRTVREMEMKTFNDSNMASVNDLYQQLDR